MMNATVNLRAVNVQRGRAHPEGKASTHIKPSVKHTNVRSNTQHNGGNGRCRFYSAIILKRTSTADAFLISA